MIGTFCGNYSNKPVLYSSTEALHLEFVTSQGRVIFGKTALENQADFISERKGFNITYEFSDKFVNLGKSVLTFHPLYTYTFYLFIHPSIYSVISSIHPPVCSFICQYIDLSIHQSIHLPYYFSMHPINHSSDYPFINIHSSIYPCIHPSIHISVHPSIHLSTHLSIYPVFINISKKKSKNHELVLNMISYLLLLLNECFNSDFRFYPAWCWTCYRNRWVLDITGHYWSSSNTFLSRTHSPVESWSTVVVCFLS